MVYVEIPVGLMVKLPPEQIAPLLTTKVGVVLTVMVAVGLVAEALIQPAAEVPLMV